MVSYFELQGRAELLGVKARCARLADPAISPDQCQAAREQLKVLYCQVGTMTSFFCSSGNTSSLVDVLNKAMVDTIAVLQCCVCLVLFFNQIFSGLLDATREYSRMNRSDGLFQNEPVYSGPLDFSLSLQELWL